MIIIFNNYFVTNGIEGHGFKLREWSGNDVGLLQKHVDNNNVRVT